MLRRILSVRRTKSQVKYRTFGASLAGSLPSQQRMCFDRTVHYVGVVDDRGAIAQRKKGFRKIVTYCMRVPSFRLNPATSASVILAGGISSVTPSSASTAAADMIVF